MSTSSGVDVRRQVVVRFTVVAAEASRRRSSMSSTLGSREGKAFRAKMVARTTLVVLIIDLDLGGRMGLMVFKAF